MRIFFFSKNGLAIDLVRALRNEGHEIRLYIDEKQSQECFDGLAPKVLRWEEGVSWVGKEGLIIFDDAGYGKLQDILRGKGYAVVGGSVEADRIELDRQYGQKIFAEYGLQTAELIDCDSVQEAIVYIEKHPKKWVLKRNGSLSKQLYFIGEENDGSDVIAILHQHEHDGRELKSKITLHERIEGVEFGIGRYFNGNDWIGPIEFNLEHARLYPGGVGPVTNEMGTLAWYSANEKSRLYRETLLKLKPYLRKICFKGDFALNCMINERGAFILEATPRFGSPIIHLQQQLHVSPWGNFLNALARGEQYNLEWKKGYGIVVLLATPPFPYVSKEINRSSYGLTFSLAELTPDDWRHLALEEVAVVDATAKKYRIADRYGYILYASAVNSSVPKAQRDVYRIVHKIDIPRVFYRNDIGTAFAQKDRRLLKEYGYLP